MPSMLLRFALFLTLLFTVTVEALRGQVVDDRAVRALLLPPAACPPPCFMGVRAGTTDGQTAMSMLTRHAWVLDEPIFIQPINDINTHYIMWGWSGAQPAGVDGRWQGQMRVHKAQVAGMTIRTTLPMGAVWLLLGGARTGVIISATSRPERDVMVIAVFPAASLLARITLPKQASTAAFWNAAVEIESVDSLTIEYFSQYRLPHWCRLRCPS